MNSVAFIAVCEGCGKYLASVAPSTKWEDSYAEVDPLLHYALTERTPEAMRALCGGKCPECGGEFRIEKIGHVARLEAENERLRETLKFFADGKHITYVVSAEGVKEIARKALEEEK